MTPMTARLVLSQELLMRLLGLQSGVELRAAVMGADGSLQLVVEGEGWPAGDGPPRAAVGELSTETAYGPFELRTVDWGFCRRQLS